MDELVEQAFKKALPKIREYPELMLGYGGVGSRDVASMKVDKNLRIDKLIRGNRLFEIKHEELGITQREGDALRSYLQHEAHKERDTIKQKFPYLI